MNSVILQIQRCFIQLPLMCETENWQNDYSPLTTEYQLETFLSFWGREDVGGY